MKKHSFLWLAIPLLWGFVACSNYLDDFEDDFGNASYGASSALDVFPLSSSFDDGSLVPDINGSSASVEENKETENATSASSADSSDNQESKGDVDEDDSKNEDKKNDEDGKKDENEESSSSSSIGCPKNGDGWELLYDVKDKDASLMSKDSSAYGGILFQFKDEKLAYDIINTERVCVEYKASSNFDFGFGYYDSESDFYFLTTELDKKKTYSSLILNYGNMKKVYSDGNKDLSIDNIAKGVSALKAFKNAEIKRISVYKGSSIIKPCLESGLILYDSKKSDDENKLHSVIGGYGMSDRLFLEYVNESMDLSKMDSVCIEYREAPKEFHMYGGFYENKNSYKEFYQLEPIEKGEGIAYVKLDRSYSSDKNFNLSKANAFSFDDKNLYISRLVVYGKVQLNSCSNIDLENAKSEFVSECFDSKIKNSRSGMMIFDATEGTGKLGNGSEWDMFDNAELSFEKNLMKVNFRGNYNSSPFFSFDVDEEKDIGAAKNISDWGGICVTYVSSENLTLYAYYNGNMDLVDEAYSYEIGELAATFTPLVKCVNWLDSPNSKLKKITDIRFVTNEPEKKSVAYIQKVYTMKKINQVLYDESSGYTIDGNISWEENKEALDVLIKFLDVRALGLNALLYDSVYIEYDKGDAFAINVIEDGGAQYYVSYKNSGKNVAGKFSGFIKAASGTNVELSSLKNPIIESISFECNTSKKDCDDLTVGKITLVPYYWRANPAQ